MGRRKTAHVRLFFVLTEDENSKLQQILERWDCTISEYICMIGYRIAPVKGESIVNSDGTIPHGILRTVNKGEKSDNTRSKRINGMVSIETKKRISALATEQGVTLGKIIADYITRDFEKNNVQIIKLPIDSSLADFLKKKSTEEGCSVGDYLEKLLVNSKGDQSVTQKKPKKKKSRQQCHDEGTQLSIFDYNL